MNRRTLGKGVLLAAAAATAIGLNVSPAGAGGGVTAEGETSGSGGGKGAVFPIRGKHTYGDGLGAGRGHQGQDVMADCGTRLVAPRAGKVRLVDYQGSGAGNYLVIKSKGGERFDYVMMHLERKPSVREGERVRAGETVGRVGTTGSSSACHLHFEMWTAPGWYKGGGVKDPKPYLKRWDRSS
jgi:murein DD-endopeptidase MepM/ murein hydrolase activator NlpD